MRLFSGGQLLFAFVASFLHIRGSLNDACVSLFDGSSDICCFGDEKDHENDKYPKEDGAYAKGPLPSDVL
jgi:hypothetical protein